MINIATVGTSQIASQFISAAKNLSNARIHAVFSRKKESGESFAEKNDVAIVYTDFDEMCSDKQIDVIYIASPNSTHYMYAKKAMESNKHCIIEKPFCANAIECKELIRIAKDRKLILFEAIPTLYSDEYKHLKDEIKKIGAIQSIHATYCQKSRKYEDFLKGELPNSFNPAMAGGALLDLNIYNLHAVVDICNEPQDVAYYSKSHANGIDLIGTAVLRYKEFDCVCIASKISTGKNTFQIQGENGYIEVVGGINFGESITSSVSNSTCKYTNFNDRLYNELGYFCTMVEKNDLDICYEILEHTQLVLTVCDALRWTKV